jgi:mRNA interferase MazF
LSAAFRSAHTRSLCPSISGADRSSSTIRSDAIRGWYASVSQPLPPLQRPERLVLTRNEAIPVLRTLLVAPISRTIRRIPTEVPLGLSEGLPVASAATFDGVLTLPKSMLVRRMGALAPDRHTELCEAFAAAVDC